MFLVLVISVYFLMNWYVLARLAHLFGIQVIIPLPVVAAALALSLPAAIMLEMRFGHRLTGMLSTAATMWAGICFLFVWCVLAFQVFGWVIKLPPAAMGTATIGIVAAVTLYAVLNAPRVVTRQTEIAAPVDLRIVQISDVHVGSVGGAFFSRLIDRVNGTRPDAVLITGDLLDYDNAMTVAALENLNRLEAPVFFVSGNHETYVGYDKVQRLLASTKVRWLRNEAVTLGPVRIVGVDDQTTGEVIDDLLARTAELDDPAPDGTIDERLGRIAAVDRQALKEAHDDLLGQGSGGEAFTILMCHRPESLDTAARRNVDLMLSGHTHQGQIWPFNYVVRSIYEYVGGWHDIGTMHLHVSPGTGTWGPRMRLGSHSEITVIDLKAGD